MARVLVLDDDAGIADLVRLVLEDAGHEAVAVVSADALPAVELDCVVTDLMGIGLYTRERAREWLACVERRYPGVPLVVMTAYREAEPDRDALGARTVIIKPFDVDQILTAVREATS